jgi:hypothetical protein
MKNHNRKRKIVLGSIYLLIVIVVGAITYYYQFYEEDVNQSLPLTVTVETNEHNDQENIASQLLSHYLQQYQETIASSRKRITNAKYNKFQLLAGDEQQFAVGVTFDAQLERGKWSAHRSWGKIQKDGTVKGIQWTLRIKQTGENTYTLERIENTSQAIAGLDPLTDMYQKEAGIKVQDENNRYEIVNEVLKVTFDHGEHWQTVPVGQNDLFDGAYSGSKKELIEGS